MPVVIHKGAFALTSYQEPSLNQFVKCAPYSALTHLKKFSQLNLIGNHGARAPHPLMNTACNFVFDAFV